MLSKSALWIESVWIMRLYTIHVFAKVNARFAKICPVARFDWTLCQKSNIFFVIFYFIQLI